MNTPGGRDRLRELGAKSVPVLARGKDFVFGQSLKDVAKFVGVQAVQQERLAPDTLMQKWLTVLSAAQRYARQIPPEKLEERLIEGREQSARHMAYHVFRIGHAFLQTAVNEVEDWTTISMEHPPDTVRNGSEIAAYGETVKKQLSDWWSTERDKSCQQDVTTFTGKQSLHEFLERQTWHSAQHVRQIAAALERLGIKPDGPLTEQDLAGLPLPSGLG